MILKKTTVIIGAGHASLTAAWELEEAMIPNHVLEASDQPGGISKTVKAGNFRFDLGGHRFFTKVTKVKVLWAEMLNPDEILIRPSKSRILYRGKFFNYPLKPIGASPWSK